MKLFSLSSARWWVAWTACLTAVWLLSGCGSSVQLSDGVHLMLSADTLEPTSTFEVRFDELMVGDDAVGLPAVDSPLRIQPALAGQFVWLSQRSGVFTPAVPPELGRTYRFSLRPGLTAGSGKPLKARLSRQAVTPPFGAVLNQNVNYQSNAPSAPRLELIFNAAVETNTVASYAFFREATGTRIPARVEFLTVSGTYDPLFNPGGDPSLLPWDQRFYIARAKSRDRPPGFDRPSEADERRDPIPNRVFVSPARPLTVGKNWTLVLERAFPSAKGDLRLPSTLEFPIGDVIPFTVTDADADNNLRSGRRIHLTFSKTISTEITSTNLGQWVQITPTPTNLVMQRNYGLDLLGDFALDTAYRVTIKAGFPSEEPFALEKAYATVLTFSRLRQRLYFPAFSVDQLSVGRRTFELLSLNLSNLRLRVKALDRNTLIHALRGYQSYFRERRAADDEPYREVDFNVLPGRTIYQTNLHVEYQVDHPQKTVLHWDEILGTNEYGAVFVSAERDSNDTSPASLGTEALVQLTDLGLAWKRDSKHRWIHVFSYRSGAPVSGATVQLMTEENESLAERTTDADGMAEVPDLPRAQWLMVENEKDLHAVSLGEQWNQQMPIYGFDFPVRWNLEDVEPHRVQLFSDRPLYRPGETVFVKALVRDTDENHLVVPQQIETLLCAFDSHDRKFFETNLVFSAWGSADAAVRLPIGTLGNYRVELAFDPNRKHTHFFQVQEFRPNAFEINLGAKLRYLPSEPVEIPVVARYFFGKPLSGAKLRWTLDCRDVGFHPEGFASFRFTSDSVGDSDLGYRSGAVVLQGNVDYDGKSPFSLRPTIPMNVTGPQPRLADLLVEMTDLNQQTLSSRAEFTLHSSAFYLGLQEFKDVLREGEPVPLELIAVQPDGQPYVQAVPVRVRVSEVQWRTIRVQSAGNAIAYRQQPALSNVFEIETATHLVHRVGVKWEMDPMEKNSTAPLRQFIPHQAGVYLVEARARDAASNDVVTAATFSVAGAHDRSWNYRNEAQIEIVPDKKEYLAGQTATLLLKTPIEGSAWVTVERDTVLRSYLTNLTGHAPALQIPLTESDAPNVFVSVILLRGADQSSHQVKAPDYRLGYCQLNVEAPATRLQVSVHSEAGSYQPRQTVTVLAEVRDSLGQPVPQAEVTLYAVDEGVLALMDYSIPDPHAFFYAIQPLGVFSFSSLPNLLPEDPSQLRFGNKGYLVGGGGRENERSRKNFLPCAFWQPALHTDDAGKLKATFLAPDSLTRYRLMAVACTTDSRFASAESVFEISKPLMVEPALPQFARERDEILARAVVHNQTEQSAEVEVTLELDDKARPVGGPSPKPSPAAAPSLSQRVAVAARGSAKAEFRLQFQQAGLAEWRWRARFVQPAGSAFEDAVQSRVQVGYVAPLLQEIYLGRSQSAETNLLVNVNPQLLEGRGTACVRVALTRLAALSEATRQLLHYPYGCIEQTCSSLLPWLVLSGFTNAFPEVARSPEEIRQVVERGINRIFSMQTSGGGMAFWPGGYEPTLWASAYAGITLSLAQQQGFHVPAANRDSLLAYLRESLRNSADLRDNYDLSDRCFALFALAEGGSPEIPYHELLFQKRAALSAESRALLALAILKSPGPADQAAELLNPKTSLPPQGDLWFGCGARELALRLLAWLRYQPDSNPVEILVEELMRSARDAHWTTTQGDAWALLALSEYARIVEETQAPLDGSIHWQDDVRPFTLRPDAPFFEVSLPTRPLSPASPLVLANPSQRRIFTQVTLTTRPKVESQPRQDRGFGLQRSYWLVLDDGTLHEFKDGRVGDRVLVSLRLEIRQPAHYVAIDDPLPATFEAVNPEFKTQQSAGSEALTTDWVSDYRELRADRVLFFRDHLPPGTYTIQYLARVRAAGSVVAPAARIQEMYHPDRFGLTDTVPVTSLPLE